MPFNFLVWDCLVRGKTSVGESGKVARMKHEPGECILAFELDNDGFRTRFGLKGDKACDALFFYWSAKKGPTVFFVELKGRDISTAVKQLERTVQTLQSASRDFPGEQKAVIVTDRKVPQTIKNAEKLLFDRYRVALKICRDGDLRQYL